MKQVIPALLAVTIAAPAATQTFQCKKGTGDDKTTFVFSGDAAIMTYTFASTKLCDAFLAAQPFQHNADLVLG